MVAAVAQTSGATAVLCPLLGTPPQNTVTGDPHQLQLTSAHPETGQGFTSPCHARHRCLKQETLEGANSSRQPASSPGLPRRR